MSTKRRSTLVAIAILLVLAAAGCAGPADETLEDAVAQAGTSATDPDEPTPGIPEQGAGEPAPGAPGASSEKAADGSGKATPEEPAPGAPGAPGGPGGEAPEAGEAPGAPGVPGPGPEEETKAPESPILIPPFQQIGGLPADDVRQEIEAAIREACTPSHDLCVTVVMDPSAVGTDKCFGGTKPDTNPEDNTKISLPRGSVLTILVLERECGSEEQTPPSSSGDPQESQPPSSS